MKIEGAGTANVIRKQETVVKTTIKAEPAQVANGRANAGVTAARAELGNVANMVRARLSNAFAAAAAAVKPAVAPTLTPADARAKADDIVARHGGRDNLDTDGVGRELADLARSNPSDARAVQLALLGDKIDEGDKGKVRESDKDEIAQSFARAMSEDDLAKTAESGDGRALLERFERHLLSGSVHSDEARDAGRIESALARVRTFSDLNNGIDPNSDAAMMTPYGTAFDPNAAPEDAAAALKSPYRPTYDPAGDVQAFTTQLEAHKDDPQWTQRYYAALGKEKAAELINLAATPSAYSNYGVGMSGNPKAAEAYGRNMTTIAGSLDALTRSGAFGQDDMNRLVDTLARRGFATNLVPDMFAKASPEVREMFVRAAERSDNATLDASAAYVLGTMTDTKKSQLLTEFAGTPGRLEGFVKNAMAGQFDAIDMSNYLSTGIADKSTAVGAASLLETAARGTQYIGSTLVPQPLSDDVRLKMFDGATQALTDSKTFGRLSGDTRIKDAIASLAVSQHDAFIDRALARDDARTGEDLDAATRAQYSKLMQFALFTPPLGEKSGDLMKFVDNRFNEIGNDLKNLSAADFEAKYHRNPAAMARAFGEMTGEFFKALDEGLTKVKDDAAKAAEIMDPIFKVFDFASGKALDKAGPVGKALSTLIDLSGVSDTARDAIKEHIKNGRIEDALKEMKDNGIDVANLGEKLYEAVHNNLLPNAGDPNATYNGTNIKDAWQNGYDHVEGAPKG